MAWCTITEPKSDKCCQLYNGPVPAQFCHMAWCEENYGRTATWSCITYALYRKISNIIRIKSQNLNVSRLDFHLTLCNILSGERRWSWSSADSQCSNYIWVTNNLIAYRSASYFRDLTLVIFIAEFARDTILVPCQITTQVFVTHLKIEHAEMESTSARY